MDGLTKLSDFLLILTLISCFTLEIRGYNLDTRIPIIKQGDVGSFFGFSVTGHTITKSPSTADDGYANSLWVHNTGLISARNRIISCYCCIACSGWWVDDSCICQLSRYINNGTKFIRKMVFNLYQQSKQNEYGTGVILYALH